MSSLPPQAVAEQTEFHYFLSSEQCWSIIFQRPEAAILGHMPCDNLSGAAVTAVANRTWRPLGMAVSSLSHLDRPSSFSQSLFALGCLVSLLVGRQRGAMVRGPVGALGVNPTSLLACCALLRKLLELSAL